MSLLAQLRCLLCKAFFKGCSLSTFKERNASSVTLPRSTFNSPERPCVPMTRRSGLNLFDAASSVEWHEPTRESFNWERIIGLAFVCPQAETWTITARPKAVIDDENASCAPALLDRIGATPMQQRRHFKQTAPLQVRL